MSVPEDYAGLVLPPRPEAPLHGECCGRGCEHCVYIVFEEAVRRWEEQVVRLKAEYLAKAGAPDHGHHTIEV